MKAVGFSQQGKNKSSSMQIILWLVLPAFVAQVNPVSTIAKLACIQNSSVAL